MTNTLQLNISKTNSKLGFIHGLNLPPIITCRPDAPCKKLCYGCHGRYNFPNVKNPMQENLELYQTNPDSFFTQLDAELKISRFFRMHATGDIVDGEYFSRLVKVARRNKHCEILIFTKKFEIVNQFLDDGHKIPKNLIVIFSNWGDWICDNPHNLPTTNIIFKGATEIPENWKICGGNCAECACRGLGCWQAKKGDIIAFHQH